MKTKHQIGDRRIKDKFVWFPKKIDGNWIWLEDIRVEEIFSFDNKWEFNRIIVRF